MSAWTHIIAAIHVDTYIQDQNIEKIVREMMANAPKITGSEGPADIFVNIPSGFNLSVSADCNSCKYKDTIEEAEDCFTCDAEDDFICPMGEYQTRAVITIVGDLRDRLKETTEREYEAFLKFLENECNFLIRNQSLEIEGY